MPTEPARGVRRKPSDLGGYKTAIGILLVLIAYGSLYPFVWNFETPNAFVMFGGVGIVDLVENILLFVPLGCVLAWYLHRRGRMVAGFVYWFVLALVFASVLQWLQVYLPRTPALTDIVFNMVGHLLGWGIGQASARVVARSLEQHQGARAVNHFALVMVLIWIVAELFPLLPTFDVSTVVNNVKSLWQQSAWQPRRMLEHVGMTVIGLHALANVVRGGAWERHALTVSVLSTLVVLAGKFVVVGQSPGLAVVLGIAGGWVLWWAIHRASERRRWSLVLGVAGLTYLISALAPYTLAEVPTAMHWIPFTSSLETGIVRALPAVAFECLCYGAMVWSAARKGGSAAVSAVLVALLALVCEFLQQYLPGRTAEISSVVLVLWMGWLVVVLDPRRSWRERSAVPHAPLPTPGRAKTVNTV